MEAARSLERAATGEAIRWAHDELDLTYEEIAALLGVSERTILRWRTEPRRPQRRQQARFEHLYELRQLLGEMFSSRQAALEWLHQPNPSLRGRTPLSELRAGRVERIVEMLATFQAGAFI